MKIKKKRLDVFSFFYFISNNKYKKSIKCREIKKLRVSNSHERGKKNVKRGREKARNNERRNGE